MSKRKTLEAKLQSEIDNEKEAKNSSSGFKQSISSGTRGAGDTYRNQR